MSSHIDYALHDGVHLAYRVDGDAPLTLLYLRAGTISIDSYDDEPRAAAYFRRLASFTRLVRMDPRGVGLSDPLVGETTARAMAQDALAVVDATGAERFVVLGEMSGGPVAIALAALAPDRVAGLVLVNTFARVANDPATGYECGHPQELVDSFLGDNFDPSAQWEVEGSDDAALLAPSLADDTFFRDWWVRVGRRGASPATARLIQIAVVTADERAALDAIRTPTLVVHRRDAFFLPVGLGRYLAARISGAKYVELAGADALPWSGQPNEISDEIEEFLTNRRVTSSERQLVTLLFTDIVGSTDRLAAVGDRSWNQQLDLHDAVMREQLHRFGGREVSTAGDSFFAVFETPSHALACANAAVAAARGVGIEIRAGLHTGECDVRGDDYGGIAVVIAARVGALAGANEVLVTSTVREVVLGSEVGFERRGNHTLKGVPGEWALYAATS